MSLRVVTFDVIGIAQPKGSTQAFVPLKWAKAAVAEGKAPRAIVTTDNPKSKGWQQLVVEQAQDVARAGQFVGPVVLSVTFHLPRPASLPKRVRHHVKKPDLDKLVRSTKDALKGVLYHDDAQVVELHARKCYAVIASAPRACISVAEAAAPDPVQTDLRAALFAEG